MIEFNEDRDIISAHHDSAMKDVLHIFDSHWHGIRAATACLPGGKLGISHKEPLSGEAIRHIEGLIFKHGFRKICFQGYSETADELAGILKKNLGSDIRQYAVTHVTTSQFEHNFEMHMLKRIYERLEKGVIFRAGSVKPGFQTVMDRTWPECLINLPPNLSRMRLALPDREEGTVFIPVENTWRKNLYTQVIAAQQSERVARIILVNWPTHLDQLLVLDKIQMIGFQSLTGLLAYMRLSEAVCNVSLSECQPMTQLEALAVGTPTLVNKLRVPRFSSHELSELTEIDAVDDPGTLRTKLDLLLEQWRTNSKGLLEMIADFVQLRVSVGLDSYREFFGY